MRAEDQQQIEAMTDTLTGTFGVPGDPERTVPRVLIAIAALSPIAGTLRDPRLVGALWITPDLLDAFERAGEALEAIYGELESALDEVTILEPGTLGDQPLAELPRTPRQTQVNDGIPRPVGAPRGDLIR